MNKKLLDAEPSDQIENKIDAISNGNEVLQYLINNNVKLNHTQQQQLIDMGLTLRDLLNMNIEKDPETLNELCSELKLSIGPKIKMRTAISDLQHNNDDMKSTDLHHNSNDITNITIGIIGNGCVGKTSILTRFVDNQFSEQRVETVSVDQRNKLLNILDTTVKLRLLDTAGTENFGSISSWYYRSSHAFVVVYDVTNGQSFEGLKFWLKRIEDYGSDTAIRFIVGTKIDLENKRIISYNEGKQFALSMGYRFLEVSAKSGRNINQIFTTVSLYTLQAGVKVMNTSILQDDSQLSDPGVEDNNERGCCSR
eukprot:137524_1